MTDISNDNGSILPGLALELLDLADAISLNAHGFPVRSWDQIRTGAIPEADDLSISDEDALLEAFRLMVSGEKPVPLTGMTPDLVIDLLKQSMSANAIEIAMTLISIDGAFQQHSKA